MAYPKNLLNDNEQIVFDRHPHWSFMLGAIVMITLAALVFVVIAVISGGELWWIGAICLLFALLGSVGRYLRWRTTEFVLTSDRLVIRQGILAKQGMEIPLDRIMNLAYHQALWERLLGTGDLVVESAGESGHQVFTDVANPAGVQNLIYRTAEEAEVRDSGGGMGGHPTSHEGSHQLSIPEQIEKLAELRDRGILSEPEFLEKKQNLLDRM